MTRLVVDASVFGLVILRQISSDRLARVEALLADHSLAQPAHWPLELAGLVLRGARDIRLPAQIRATMRDRLAGLMDSAEIDGPLPATAVYDVALRFTLSVYDAAYLELAARKKLPLLTVDGPLHAAAQRAEVELIVCP